MKQVLIIDDSEQIRRRLAALLAESSRIRIAGQAGNMVEALKAVRTQKPDTVVLDIRMPGGSGIDLLKEIKSRYPTIKVIMLTNFDDDLYRRQCKQLGADDFLNKTIEFDKVTDAILKDTHHETPKVSEP